LLKSTGINDRPFSEPLLKLQGNVYTNNNKRKREWRVGKKFKSLGYVALIE
jgi:hypothetical protein